MQRCVNPAIKHADLLPMYENKGTLDTTVHNKYRSLIRILLYLAVCTRPDVSFSVSVLARQVHNPTPRNFSYLRRILRYISGTVNMSLKYHRSDHVQPQSLRAHVDADCGGCHDTRKSTSGLIIDGSGTPIVWRTRKQTLVATLSGETEYVAVFDCAKHLCWMNNLFLEMAHEKK